MIYVSLTSAEGDNCSVSIKSAILSSKYRNDTLNKNQSIIYLQNLRTQQYQIGNAFESQ